MCPLRRAATLAFTLYALSTASAARAQQTSEEFSDDFPKLEVRGGAIGGRPCQEETRTVCLPKTCEIDLTRTQSTSTRWGGGFGKAEPGFGALISEINAPGGGSATHNLDPVTKCLKSTVRVCALRRQRGFYAARHVIYARCGCPCADGHWYDRNRKSCVTGACGKPVPGMPNGDKGGGYFAWDNNLFVDTPCLPPPCDTTANRVRNPSFEQANPQTSNAISAATGWSALVASPDLWTTAAGNVPTNGFGTEPAAHGRNYAGISSGRFGTTFRTEALAGALAPVASGGQTYRVSLQMSRGEQRVTPGVHIEVVLRRAAGGAELVVGQTLVAQTNGWQTFSWTVAVPAGASYDQIVIRGFDGQPRHLAGYIYVDDAMVVCQQ